MKIHYVTSNYGKFEEACHILTGWQLDRVDLDIEEIQGTREAIIKAKARTAVAHLNSPIIVEDVAVECDALNGLPGPYIKDFLKALGEKGLYELVEKVGNYKATVICTAAYAVPDTEPLVFEGTVAGTIVAPKGELRHGKYSWNPIFVPEGHEITMGEMSMEEHAQVSMRGIALNKLRDSLNASIGTS